MTQNRQTTKLASRQQVFIAEYLVDLNATRAASVAGYSKKTARQQGARLLTNVDISSEISARQDERLKRLDVTADRILEEIARLAFVDPRKFFDANGRMKQVRELDDDTAASIASLEVNELFEGDGEQKHAFGLVKKIRFSDKLRALEMLGRHHKLFTDKVENTGPGGGPIAVTVDRAIYE